MAFIKEETQDFRIEKVFSLKQEDFEELTGWFSFSMHLILIKMMERVMIGFIGKSSSV